MIKYIHTFRVISGKVHKEVIRVYKERYVAREMLTLLGGILEVVEVKSLIDEEGKCSLY